MANTTFSGPVRSENGFEQITKNSTTGAITVEATYDARPNFRQTIDNSTLNTGADVTTTLTIAQSVKFLKLMEQVILLLTCPL